ncbi:hypothetical protein BH23BAC1_BH23BAC1_08330 [soil metagenome]
MQSFPEKDFDDFIRKAVEEPNLSFDPKAWKAMEKKLDARPGFLTSRGMDLFSIFALILMISYLTWTDSGAVNRYTGSNLGTTATAETEVDKISSFEGSPGSTKEITVSSTPEKTTETKIFNKSSDKINKNNKENLKEKNASTKNYNSVDQNLPVKINSEFANGLKVETENADIAEEKNAETQKILSITKRPAKISNSELNSIKRISVLPETTEIIPAQRKGVSPKWAVNLMVSPDLSAVKLSEINTSGTNLGISIEYYISSRWRVSLGAIRSQKIYAVGKSSSSGYYSNPQTLEKVDASCSVIDIPLILRYNALSIGKNHFFISSGLSSYLMLKEDYDFTYQNSNSTYSYSKNIRNENNHFMGIMNFSLGMERESWEENFLCRLNHSLKPPFQISDMGK